MISPLEMTAMIALCSFFNAFILVSDRAAAFNGSSSLLLKFFGFLLSFLLALPVFLLFKRHQGMGLIECAYDLTGKCGTVFALLYFVFFMLMALNTVTGVEFFLTSTVYNFDSKFLILSLFSLLILYTLYTGLESLGRTAVIIFVLFLVVVVLILLFLIPQFNLEYIYSPFYDGLKPYLSRMPVVVSQNNTFIPLFVLLPFVNRGRKKIFSLVNIINLIVIELLMFATTAVLGDYTPKNIFSMYTLVTMINTSKIHRLDSIHIAIWVLLSFVRTALLLYCACYCLRNALPGRFHKYISFGTVFLFFIGGFLFSSSYDILRHLYDIIYSGIPLLVVELFLPLLLLLISLIRRKKHVSKQT
ncbi:MAG: hypothetical protein E7487_08230 [Ruminococcaceae bacterium]|nr:hypothetical protein [Oscillospiraceae bacterium]